MCVGVFLFFFHIEIEIELEILCIGQDKTRQDETRQNREKARGLNIYPYRLFISCK